jgi:hypothetical protein
MANPPRYIEFPLEGGGTILIESPDQQEKVQSGFVKGAEVSKEAATRAAQTFDAAVENIRKSAELLVNKLRSISAPPDEMSVSFGLKASGDLGSLAIGKVGSEANYAVTLKWKKEEPKKKEEGKKEEGSGKKEEEEPRE